MPKKTKSKTLKDTKIVGKTLSELKKEIVDRKASEMAQNNIGFDRNIKLPASGEGNRFLVMRRKVEKDGDDATMQRVNPIMAGKLIRGVGGVIDMKLIRDGGLLIRAKNWKSANAICQIVRIPGFKVVVTEYAQLNKSVGVIYDRALIAATDDEILKELEPKKCIKVKRVQKTMPDGTKRDTGTFFLTFGTVTLPKFITIGYSNIQITAFVPNPTRCFKCQRFGHVSNSCKSEKKICVNCGMEEHVEEGEKCANRAKCVNCESTEHNSMSRDCPEFMYRKKIEDIKVHEEKSHVDATRLLDARDPLARPSKKQRQTYASTTRALTCKCCTCGANPKTGGEKRSQTELLIESDEEVALRNIQQQKKTRIGRDLETADDGDDHTMKDVNNVKPRVSRN